MEKLVLPERIELSASPLPRECSTPELRQHGEPCAIGLVKKQDAIGRALVRESDRSGVARQTGLHGVIKFFVCSFL
jgi:hypothetical protein